MDSMEGESSGIEAWLGEACVLPVALSSEERAEESGGDSGEGAESVQESGEDSVEPDEIFTGGTESVQMSIAEADSELDGGQAG